MIFIAICSCLLTLARGKVNPDIEAGESINISMCVYVCMHSSTVKASSVWGWNSRRQINDVVV